MNCYYNMPKARKGWAVLKYERGDSFVETKGGIIVATPRTRRAMVKGTSHVISSDPDNDLDAIRVAEVISAEGLKQGTQVLFNRHDGWGFEYDEKYFFLIKSELIMATLD